MNPLERIRIEKAAADCGFEREAVLKDDGQLELRSASFPEVVWVRAATAFGYQLTATLPSLLATGSDDGELLVEDIEQLYQSLQQAAATARTMPNRVANQFRAKTQTLPKTTEAERLVVQRVGQDLFRSALLDYWQGRCCVTGLAVPSLLRASHIKPWAKCESDNERLDVFNGLLLAPHLDALFAPSTRRPAQIANTLFATGLTAWAASWPRRKPLSLSCVSCWASSAAASTATSAAASSRKPKKSKPAATPKAIGLVVDTTHTELGKFKLTWRTFQLA